MCLCDNWTNATKRRTCLQKKKNNFTSLKRRIQTVVKVTKKSKKRAVCFGALALTELKARPWLTNERLNERTKSLNERKFKVKERQARFDIDSGFLQKWRDFFVLFFRSFFMLMISLSYKPNERTVITSEQKEACVILMKKIHRCVC